MPAWLRYLFIASLTIVALLLFAAVAGGASSAAFERYFPILLVTNVFAAVTLFAIVASVILRLVKNLREGVYGSRMTAKMAVMTGIIATVPCILIYMVSNQFIGRSIDSWFDVRVEHALESGVKLSSEILNSEQVKLRNAAKRIADFLEQTPKPLRANMLDRMRETTGTSLAIIFDLDGGVLHTSMAPAKKPHIIDSPTRAQLAEAVKEDGIYILEGDSSDLSEELRMRALIPIQKTQGGEPEAFLQLTQQVPQAIAVTAGDLVTGYRDYQELSLSRHALRNIYSTTLTLTMLLAVLAAIAVSLAFARNMTAPVMQLALGTKHVAEGDLRPIREFSGNSELNELTQSFNSMISQIAEARTTVENQKLEAERARKNLEHILANLTSGVLVVDDDLRIVTSNAAAKDILQPGIVRQGVRLSACAPGLAAAVLEQITVSDEADFHAEIELQTENGAAPMAVFVRGSRITLENGRGWVVVFDDITTVLDAQKALAWGEVARRLAHEIKNPLTPIRLAAERLQMKLENKLDEKDSAMLLRTCGTIVNQVDAMKQMVNDFRDYARLPSANLQPLDLNSLLTELAGLYVTGGTPVATNLSEALPHVMGDATQLRQVIHNLMGNAVDATHNSEKAAVNLSSQPVVRSSDGKCIAAKILIEDNGPGFTPQILARAFEPYVTTKSTGTGLGLPMVKKIIDEHHGKVSLENRTDPDGNVSGARVTITIPATYP